jgi:hypothetical protein
MRVNGRIQRKTSKDGTANATQAAVHLYVMTTSFRPLVVVPSSSLRPAAGSQSIRRPFLRPGRRNSMALLAVVAVVPRLPRGMWAPDGATTTYPEGAVQFVTRIS